MVDLYPGAIQMHVPDANVFWGANPSYAIVLHGTAGWDGASAQDIANMFINAADRRSSHFVVGRDGTVVQCVALSHGAGANCCLSAGHDTFWDIGVPNLNTVTISIEHVHWTDDNSDPLTPAQEQSSFKLVKWICDQKGIAASHIKSHGSLDPANRSRCPGNYPWTKMFAYLAGGNMGVPNGWTDKNGVITAPNGKQVTLGFADYIRNNDWDGKNQPLENAVGADPVEEGYNQTPSKGTRQLFNYSELAWTSARGVYLVGIGNELRFVRADRDKYKAQAAQLQQQVAALQNTDTAKLQQQLAAAQAQIQDLTSKVSAKNSALTGIATAATAASK